MSELIVCPAVERFATNRHPLVSFPQDFIPVHLLDQRTDYQAGPQVPLHSRATLLQRPLPGRVGEVLSQLYLASRSRPGGPTRGAPAGERRQRSPAWEKSSEDDTHDEVIREEEKDAEFCVEPSVDDSGIPTSGATALEALEPQADLPLPKPPSSVRRRFREDLEISCRESSASDLALIKPPTVVFIPRIRDGNINESLKKLSPRAVALCSCQNFKRIVGNSEVNNNHLIRPNGLSKMIGLLKRKDWAVPNLKSLSDRRANPLIRV